MTAPRPVIASARAGAPAVPVTGPPDPSSWLSTHGTVTVIPIRHPVIDALGHHPISDYGEQFWVPTIGPSALWAQRRITSGFDRHRSGYQLDIATLAGEIGLGGGTGRHSPIIRTLTRLLDFHLAEIIDDQLGVYTRLPPLTRRHAARLPEHLAERHRLQSRSGAVAETGR